jgi:arabinogalactan endo-1,4-beta-galactosidase
MDIESAFPSKYLKAADLQGRTPTVTISHVATEEVGRDKDRRPVLYFQGKEKGVVLNKTNATNISMGYGRDTDAWVGKPVVLFTAMVDFQGQTGPAIRIRPATPQPSQQNNFQAPTNQPPAPPPPTSVPPQFDNGPAFDDIPF